MKLLSTARVLAILTAAVLAAASVACDAGAEHSGSGATQERPRTAADELYLGGRDAFSICVAAPDGALSDATAQAVVRDALDQALAQLEEVPTQYRHAEIASDCPYPTVLFDALQGEHLDYLARNGIRDLRQIIGDDLGPDAPNHHRAFVYFVDPDTYATAFGAESYISTGEEFACDGICDAVTRALYVPVTTNRAVVRDGLLEILNLLNQQQTKDLLKEKLDQP